MKVKIGSLEITVDTLEELDALVQRYGDIEPSKDTGKDSSPTLSGGNRPADAVLLKKFIDAGSDGVTTIDVGTILGRQGKAARPALQEWAKRIGLSSDENVEVFEEARVGTQRGLRLKSSLLEVAKHLQNQR